MMSAAAAHWEGSPALPPPCEPVRTIACFHEQSSPSEMPTDALKQDCMQSHCRICVQVHGNEAAHAASMVYLCDREAGTFRMTARWDATAVESAARCAEGADVDHPGLRWAARAG